MKIYKLIFVLSKNSIRSDFVKGKTILVWIHFTKE